MYGLDNFVTEKAAEMSNQEFFSFVAEVNRAISIADQSVNDPTEAIIKIRDEIMNRLEAEEKPT